MFWVICTMKHHPTSFVAFGWSKAKSSEFTVLLSAVTSQQTPVTSSTNSDACSRLGSRAVSSCLHTFFFPSFPYKLVFVSAVYRILFHNWAFLSHVFWECLVFLLSVNDGLLLVINPLHLDSWSHLIGEWQAFLLQSILAVGRCYEGFFRCHGKNSVIIHFRLLPWFSRPPGVSELVYFPLFENVLMIDDLVIPKVSAICLTGWFFLGGGGFSPLMVFFTCIDTL